MVLGAPPLERSTGPVDLVHVLAPFVPVPSRAPLVATVHDLLPLEHGRWYKRAERAGYRRGLADVARRAARIIAVSDRVASAISDVLDVEADRITVIHEGVGEAFRREPSDTEKAQVCERYGVVPGRFVIAVGAVEARKNLAVLVAGLSGLDVTLLLAGTKGDGWEAVSGARQGAGPLRVQAPGHVPDADLPVLVASARVLAHPSLDEGFGLPPLEAMAAGTPVVLTRAGALPELAGDAAVWVHPNDVRGWRQALRATLDDDVLHAQLVAAGRARAKGLTWDRAASATVGVDRDALASARPT
jgi:glycosyltransferase involved in cell wall biosynthesis